MRRFFVLMLMVAASAAVLSQGTGAARANGVPQLVKLTYLDGVSNWGPQNGEGVLEFSFAEAYARVDVKNLTPQQGFTYDGWLTGGDGAPFLVGEIAVDSSGIGTLEARLTGLASYNYNLFVIAARATGAAAGTTLPEQRSIAGRFTVISDANSANASGDSQPALLPDTGEQPASGPNEAWRIAASIAVMAVVAGAAFAFRGIRARRVRR